MLNMMLPTKKLHCIQYIKYMYHVYLIATVIKPRCMAVGAHSPKACSSWFMYLYVCNTDFSKVTKTKRWQIQYRHSTTISQT